MLIRHLPPALLATIALTCASVGAGAATDRIVTASERGTYIEIGRDLARVIAKPAGINLEVLPSKGSADNVRRLRNEANVRLALVQADVYRAYLDQAQAGDVEAERLIKPLRVVMPLYGEEIYFVTRADSPLQFVHQIKDKRINIGPVGSGTALTATTLYQGMFKTQLSEQNTTHLSNEEALVKLATERSIDVVVIVAGQPARLLADMKQEARQYIKLLPIDANAAETRGALDTYITTTIRGSSYPNWLLQDTPAFAVKSMLVTYDYQSPGMRDTLTRLAISMCNHFDQLKTDGHAKWQEIELKLPQLPQGWTYYAPTQKVLSDCAAYKGQTPRANVAPQAAPAAPVTPTRPAEPTCTQNRAVLGLCRGK